MELITGLIAKGDFAAALEAPQSLIEPTPKRTTSKRVKLGAGVGMLGVADKTRNDWCCARGTRARHVRSLRGQGARTGDGRGGYGALRGHFV
jgi:hypothetical protein